MFTFLSVSLLAYLFYRFYLLVCSYVLFFCFVSVFVFMCVFCSYACIFMFPYLLFVLVVVCAYLCRCFRGVREFM